ncbi:MAG: GNAT family N-acetyltransferase [Alphaproteobacteria bacterium]|nr:GNAT family N-acetyltransferase [Alphaproteobacteria bacterium]
MNIIPVVTQKHLKDFILLPNRLYKDDKGYIPPLMMERLEVLNPKKNPYFDHAEHQYFLAVDGNKIVGRISAQIDRLNKPYEGKKVGHFGFLDAEDNGDVFSALIKTAEEWLKKRDIKYITGPFNHSINEEAGLLIDGYDTPSVMMYPYNRAYTEKYLLNYGFTKAKDLYSYTYNVSHTKPIDAGNFLHRLDQNNRVKLRPYNPQNHGQELKTIVSIFNDAWSDNWGFVPFTEKEIDHIAKSMKPLIVKDLIWIAEFDQRPISMIVALPNINEAIYDLNGSLFPLGLLKLLWRLKIKGLKTARVLLFGLKKEYQKTPMASILVMMLLEELRKNGKKHGFESAELGWILEDNTPTRRLIEHVGGKVSKIFRIYGKDLG